MIAIDRYAYSSKLKQIAPLQKIIFALITQAICLWADHIVISITVLLIMGGITVAKGGISLRFFLKILFIPMTFILISCLTIIVNISEHTEGLMAAIPVSGQWIGFSHIGLQHALGLFFKALGAMSCLVFLSLSTPMVDLLAAFRQLGIPKVLVEMMGLVYRFIFVLLETSDKIFMAQSCRLGYSGISSAYRSLGTLASMLFIRSYKHSDDLYTALDARGYDGELNVLEEIYSNHWSGYVFVILINILLMSATLILKGTMGGLY